ncbi:hypothetical protein TNCV_4026121 [Trichonephila clavipes]|nr:hypothetical protein TNCV_4026121 [Trichonephila clavipes]
MCGSLVVKVTDSWLACHEFEPSIAEYAPYSVDRCTFNMSRLKCPPTGMRYYGLSALSRVRQNPNHTKTAKELLENKDIQRMGWPERSLYLNFIEHLGDILCKRLLDFTAVIRTTSGMGSNAPSTR